MENPTTALLGLLPWRLKVDKVIAFVARVTECDENRDAEFDQVAVGVLQGFTKVPRASDD